jgi:hypothetical protein
MVTPLWWNGHVGGRGAALNGPNGFILCIEHCEQRFSRTSRTSRRFHSTIRWSFRLVMMATLHPGHGIRFVDWH